MPYRIFFLHFQSNTHSGPDLLYCLRCICILLIQSLLSVPGSYSLATGNVGSRPHCGERACPDHADAALSLLTFLCAHSLRVSYRIDFDQRAHTAHTLTHIYLVQVLVLYSSLHPCTGRSAEDLISPHCIPLLGPTPRPFALPARMPEKDLVESTS